MNPHHDYGDCVSKTFPIRCKICGKEVFYYSCTCGSKVFFDELGPPWPKHNCGSHNKSASVRPLQWPPSVRARMSRELAESLEWYGQNWQDLDMTLAEAAFSMSLISEGLVSYDQCKVALLRAIKKK